MATIEATAAGRKRAATARAVIIVEGISDQIALETLADRLGRDIEDEGVAVLPVGGAHAATRFLRELGPEGAGKQLAGLCDAGEEHAIRRAVAAAGLGSPQSRTELEELGFHVCVEDLEDELIRALGPPSVETLFEDQGDLGAFRTLQHQPAWRGEGTVNQMRRFLGAGSGRKLRYARLLVDSVDLARAPRPLRAVLSTVLGDM